MVLLNDSEWVKWSDREIARRYAVDNSFVSKLHRDTVDKPQYDAERTFTHAKTGKPTTMNTTNIGKRSDAVAAPTPEPQERLRQSALNGKSQLVETFPQAGDAGKARDKAGARMSVSGSIR